MYEVKLYFKCGTGLAPIPTNLIIAGVYLATHWQIRVQEVLGLRGLTVIMETVLPNKDTQAQGGTTCYGKRVGRIGS